MSLILTQGFGFKQRVVTMGYGGDKPFRPGTKGSVLASLFKGRADAPNYHGAVSAATQRGRVIAPSTFKGSVIALSYPKGRVRE